MTPQFDTQVMSSALLWLDNLILSKGSGFANYSSKFYRTVDNFSNIYTYSLPFKQVVTDYSITGAQILSGLYLNNVFINKGTSGLVDISSEQGQAYFSTGVDNYTVSGLYAVKDFPIYITSEPEEKILFETQYKIRPKTFNTATGLAPNEITFPVIFLKDNGSFNTPFAFGGLDATTIHIRAIVLGDSQFNVDAVGSIVRDRTYGNIPLINLNEMPLNIYGGFKNTNYSYTALTSGKTSSSMLYIKKVNISKISRSAIIFNEIKALNPNIYISLVDIEVEAYRTPRI